MTTARTFLIHARWIIPSTLATRPFIHPASIYHSRRTLRSIGIATNRQYWKISTPQVTHKEGSRVLWKSVRGDKKCWKYWNALSEKDIYEEKVCLLARCGFLGAGCDFLCALSSVVAARNPSVTWIRGWPEFQDEKWTKKGMMLERGEIAGAGAISERAKASQSQKMLCFEHT